MIHIEISNQQLLEIKKIWCQWFFKPVKIKEFIHVLDHDIEFRKFFFSKKKEFEDWKLTLDRKPGFIKEIKCRKPIVDYFFEDLSDETKIIKYKIHLEKTSKDFLLKNYNNYRKSRELARIIDIINIQVCPYCNRNFIESYVMSDQFGKKKFYFKGDLDHHYSKDEIPALMLSFFNLIPCCKVCNHEKSESVERAFYPYYDYEEKEYHFEIELYKKGDMDIIYEMPIQEIESKIDDYTVWQGISDNFKIKIKGVGKAELNERMENSNKMFRLEKKYNHSKEYVKEIIRKKYIYPEIKKREFWKNFPEIFPNEKALEETFYSYYDDGDMLTSRPLAKLTKDILEQLQRLN